ncbi:MAG: hypothetical protein PHE25_05965, partial [Candidatus Gracilibacteria bacterium]|nr:hypothetical protein [Candidatus Gracilibacteria bacterium]
IVGDLKSLQNGLNAYAEENSTLPIPKGNLKFYSQDSSYEHDEINSFGVSGFITEENLPRKYINYLPLDPKTGQYYGYAKTINTQNYEIAGVTFKDNIPSSVVVGNWKGEYGPYNLVKEYAGINFISDESDKYFAYNPYEKMLIGKISS